MTSQGGVSSVVCVELSPFEAQQLQECLDGLIAAADPVSSPTALTAARDTIADANALALWLRENVTIELPQADAHAVLKALPAESESPSSPEVAALTAARSKFSQCLSRCVVPRR